MKFEKERFILFDRSDNKQVHASTGVTTSYISEFSTRDEARDNMTNRPGIVYHRYPKDQYRLAKYRVTYELIDEDVE